MRAIDTNVIVRYLTGDEPEQAARVKQEWKQCVLYHVRPEPIG